MQNDAKSYLYEEIYLLAFKQCPVYSKYEDFGKNVFVCDLFVIQCKNT